MRVLFEPLKNDLNSDTLKTIQIFGNNLKNRIDHRVILLSYATVPGDDVSEPRRIALTRALTIRSVLVSTGLATTRIYPRALGRPAPNDPAPADRLDILIEPEAPRSSMP